MRTSLPIEADISGPTTAFSHPPTLVADAPVASTTSHVMIRTEFLSLRTFSDVREAIESLRGDADSGSGSDTRQPFEGLGAVKNHDAKGGRRLLCVWDVDDTLVTSGAPGVRQCPLFEEDDLISLFRGLPARHLLLSQGSIDDVFYPGKKGGKLHYIAPFFLRGDNTSEGCSSLSKVHSGCTNCFARMKGNGVKSHNVSCVTENSNTHIIRIATLRAAPENPEDHKLFLSEEQSPPRCPSDVRWLVMRPSLWGISLASLSNFIVPSANTAFLDGSVFRKMDVVRSLAASGIWDVVFFMDNNLSEVGVVRPGLGVDDYYRMKSVGKLSRFFHSDLLLLKVSEILAENNSLKNFQRHDNKGFAQFRGNGQINGVGRPSNGEVAASSGDAPSLSALRPLNEVNCSGDKALLQGYQGEKTVHLVVAHLHLDAARYQRLTKAKLETVKHQEKDWWHPTFSVGRACTDDDYRNLMTDFLEYKAFCLREAAASGTSITPLPGWEPSIAAVRYPLYERPKPLPKLCIQYRNICHQIMTDLVEPFAFRLTKERECELKKEANNLYRRLIRRQPVIDPFFIARVASNLFAVFTAERRLPRNISTVLKKEVRTFVEDKQRQRSAG